MATQWTAGTTSGQVLTSATLNTIGAVWETWTPFLSGSTTDPNLGSTGSSVGRYTRINKLVIAQTNFTFNGAGINAGAGFYKSTLPFTAQGAAWTSGLVIAVDVSTFASTQNALYLDSTTQALGIGTGGAGLAASIGAGTYAWAAGDFIRFELIYEAA